MSKKWGNYGYFQKKTGKPVNIVLEIFKYFGMPSKKVKLGKRGNYNFFNSLKFQFHKKAVNLNKTNEKKRQNWGIFVTSKSHFWNFVSEVNLSNFF